MHIGAAAALYSWRKCLDSASASNAVIDTHRSAVPLRHCLNSHLSRANVVRCTNSDCGPVASLAAFPILALEARDLPWPLTLTATADVPVLRQSRDTSRCDTLLDTHKGIHVTDAAGIKPSALCMCKLRCCCQHEPSCSPSDWRSRHAPSSHASGLYVRP